MSVDESQTEVPSGVFLVPIQRNGSVRGIAEPSPEARDVLGQTAALYLTVGFQEPWIGYLALLGGRVVGTCAFKCAPAVSIWAALRMAGVQAKVAGRGVLFSRY